MYAIYIYMGYLHYIYVKKYWMGPKNRMTGRQIKKTKVEVDAKTIMTRCFF